MEEKMKKGFFIMTVVAVFSLAVTNITAQTNPKFAEFPIAVGEDSTFIGGGAFDGTNYLVGIQGDTLGSSNITAQLVSQTGSLIGSRISVDRTGIPFPCGLPLVAFDGINYLMVWDDAALYPTCNIYGQFIDTLGNLIGASFPIATTVDNDESPCIAFGDTTYLVTWIKNDSLFGQLVGRSGSLVGTEIFISESARMPAIAFDSTNYLITWVDIIPTTDISISGQLVSKQGTLVGLNFIIDDSPYPSDNPMSICFDGSRYMVGFHEGVSNEWDLFARFVTTSGTVAERITITDEPGNQWLPCIAFDGTNYLITWTDGQWSIDTYSKGRFFNTSGVPVDTGFTIFAPLGDTIPLFTGAGFGDYQYLVVTTRCDTSTFTDGDVYGTFIPPYTGVEEKPDDRLEVADFSLQQNTPNPFNSTTFFQYTLPKNDFLQIDIYDITGHLVRTLVKGERSAGTYTVSWNGKDTRGKSVCSGIYFYSLKVGNLRSTKKMLLVK
jgi:hypothetical protein